MSTGKYWLLTIFTCNSSEAFDQWDDQWASHGIRYSKGQLEQGSETDNIHWQFIVVFRQNQRLSALQKIFGTAMHAELTRSAAANEYVWKDHTSLGNRWEWGSLPTKRNCKEDWEEVWESACEGNLLEITPSIRVQHYNNLKRIQMDHMKPIGLEKTVVVYWGPSGTGKSRRAWQEAGLDAYPKAPTTKFWDGYQGQKNVVIDEFFGQIEISHLLRWLDRYPVCIETKGSGTVLNATHIWITSNIDPRQWYPQASAEQQTALRRRIKIIYWPLVRRMPDLVASADTLPELPTSSVAYDELF